MQLYCRDQETHGFYGAAKPRKGPDDFGVNRCFKITTAGRTFCDVDDQQEKKNTSKNRTDIPGNIAFPKKNPGKGVACKLRRDQAPDDVQDLARNRVIYKESLNVIEVKTPVFF